MHKEKFYKLYGKDFEGNPYTVIPDLYERLGEIDDSPDTDEKVGPAIVSSSIDHNSFLHKVITSTFIESDSFCVPLQPEPYPSEEETWRELFERPWLFADVRSKKQEYGKTSSPGAAQHPFPPRRARSCTRWIT